MIVHKNYYCDTRVRRYTESLLKRGFQVDVICPSANYETAFGIKKGLTVYTIPIHHFDRSRIGYVFEYGASLVLYCIYLSFLHVRKRYHVIHVHNMPDILAFCALIPRILGSPLILDIHDPMLELYISKYGGRVAKLMHWFIVRQERLSCMLANAVITANSMFKENLVVRGTHANKITVINNYPNHEKFRRSANIHVQKAKREAFTLIYPGTIEPRYGLEIAIRALPLLITRIPDISLVIIGTETQHGNQLKQLSEELGVSSYTSFLSFLPPEQIPNRIAQSDIGIYPALLDAHMNIATPSKVLEFATMGIPIICSRLKIIEELFGNSSVMLFEPGNVDQFAECVVKLYENSSLREDLVLNADQEFVQKHSWHDEFQVYLDLLDQL